MINRNEVAREKMQRAAEMLQDNNIDMWVFYARLKTDTALELMFNTDSKNEVMFLLTKNGDRIAIATAADTKAYEESGLYTEVIEVSGDGFEKVFKEKFDQYQVKRLAVNDSTIDTRCDGLTVGLFKKLEKAIGAETMAKVKCCSYSMLEELRAVKTPSEIEIMKECSRITTDIYDALFKRIHVGLTEVGVAKMMMEECAKRNVVTAFGNPPEYPLVLNPKGGMSHRDPNDINKIEAGDMLVIDFSIRYNGYTSDIARTMYFLKPGEELDKVRKTIIINGALNNKIPGKSAYEIAKLAGVEVPKATKILIGEVESVDISEEFAHEKLSPVLAMYRAKTFDEALAKAEQLVADGGYGHTSSLYIHPSQTEKIEKHQQAMKTCRILINTPSSQGGIGDLYNFGLAPSLTLGCGSWGGNSVSENVGVKHLINIKTVAERRENMLWFRTPEKVYFKKGCMPVALDELGTVMHKKKAFIVTDSFLYKNGYVKPIENKLDQMGIQHTCFFEVAPDPTLQCARRGVEQIRAFEPDTIIALGGGSAMDAGKIMWLMYEHPEAKFEDMAMDFMDIRKRVYTFPKMGEKAYFIAIPTSSGTGSEVTPFAIITDADTGVKWPITDYELMPNMAIVDVDNAMTAPKGLTSASGIDVMTHAIEAYVSIMATDFTDGLAMKAVKAVFDYLPSAYENGANDPIAREKMANASCMAGMAFANAFLGLNHSMAHKLGAFHHLPHGIANAVILTDVMRYNAAEVPTRMGTFSQYQYPHALARYAELGRFAGCKGKTDEEVFENFIAKLEELKEKIGIKKTIKDYGVDEKYFLDTLDEMSEQAFNDQCTGANPRYPLIQEIKDLYLKCYYGK